MTPRTLLGGLGKLGATVAVAVIAGIAVGVGLATVTGDDDSSSSLQGGPREDSPAIATETTTSRKRASTGPRKRADDVRVRVVSAILHPSATASGRRRQRARLSVHVRVTNGTSRRVVPSRPVLVADGVRVKTDPNQDSADTDLGALAPGATGDVTLRFETAGAVTQRLRREPRVRLIIAGENVTASVKVGSPANSQATS